MTFQVIKANIQHAELLSQLGSKLFLQTFGNDNSEQDMKDYLESTFQKSIQEKEILDPTYTTYILYQGDQAIGYFQLRDDRTTVYDFVEDKDAIELKRIYIDQEFVGKGLGHIMMKKCLEEIQALGKKTVWLGVWEHNHIAQKFYKKYDFSVVGSHIFKVGDKEDCDYIMVKKM